ncbi:MAG: SUMF1/EgtB/PvdO family nonheme iron enzyme [Sphaerochaetaceae bacterium]|nr:SUMF1/EgtB/PvdO family nonheme iron enzyme [Sphaerochaetaceae bacterium]
MKKKELPKVEPVHLKEHFGMKPGKWLTLLYIAVFLLLVFLVCYLPGIVNGNKRVTFKSAVYNSAVYIDGNYAGGTPFTVTVPSGDHEIVYSVNGCEIDSFTMHVGHPVFLTWLVPRKQSVESTATLTEEAFNAVTKEFLTDTASYSAILSYDNIYNYPPLFENYAKSVSSYNGDIKGVLDLASLFITTEEMKADAENAASILNISFDTSIKTPAAKAEIAAPSSIKATELYGISGYRIGDSFCISRNEITEAQYAEFVKEVPYWSKDNLENLISDKVADSYYLADISLENPSQTRPVRNISYYAATAYCQWLSNKTGKNVSLPTENQWIQAALVAEQSYQRSLVSASTSDTVVSMFGGVWEFTSSPYIPGARYSDETAEEFLATGAEAEVVVKGGSLVNGNSGITVWGAGTWPLRTCSDYLGFRIIWDY